MQADDTLNRFLEAQETYYTKALDEIRKGRKQTHWVWFIFPQIAGLGYSEMARFYAIKDLQEARSYLDHPVLGARLTEIANALLSVEGKTANQILGNPDDLKVRSSMTLFNLLKPTDPVFGAVLARYYQGSPDPQTLRLLNIRS
ncbi:DUF1810 domain-containing protein [Spirosoma utsteinense]|uniref:Calpastatin n=1 Tax=Spirosoma utsteinense TaxID=2585773 RepID=A0ABR6W7F6_9BACT|nr:DUF1810 domain-containing protein [Spirosoma utsteinense]MBC3788989.1 putative protein (DUF1810 family) [Spirosoma utsteinense]MBC3792516.1 putative protein (DUF1810 family) [Spirosoma utsteinense]